MHLDLYDTDKPVQVLDLSEDVEISIFDGRMNLRTIDGKVEVIFNRQRNLPETFCISDESGSDLPDKTKFRNWRAITGKDTSLVIYEGEIRLEVRIIICEDDSSPF